MTIKIDPRKTCVRFDGASSRDKRPWWQENEERNHVGSVRLDNRVLVCLCTSVLCQDNAVDASPGELLGLLAALSSHLREHDKRLSEIEKVLGERK